MKRFFWLAFLFLPAAAIAEVSVWEKSLQLESKGEYAAAAALLEPMLDGKMHREFVLLRYGWLCYLQRHYKNSVDSYTKALELNPKSLDARLGLSLPLLALKRWQDAARHLKQVLLLSPWNYLAHVRLMAAEESLRQWEVLEAHAASVNQRYPSDSTILIYLARARIWQGDQDKARAAYQEVLIRDPDNLEANRYLSAKEEWKL